jgi:selenocysteine-specific elongation factor
MRAGRAAVLSSAAPVTVGTAGHVDHGKTALVAALTGTDTDRLAEEKVRGLSIELGFAAVALPSGRPMSLVDVPGHERFIRTMVAGATGIDAYLMVIAATEGVREQTVEHARILEALGITAGIVVITKTDLAAPGAAAAQARELLPGAPVVVCPPELAARRAPVRLALDAMAERLRARATRPDPSPILHVDRCFTVTGAGTVVTGTLVAGALATGERVAVYPAQREVRVRGLEVHGEPVSRAVAGQRVAVNLARMPRAAVARGDALAAPGALRAAFVIEVAPGPLYGTLGAQVHVHHGTRATAARVVRSAAGPHLRLRCRQPLLVAPGDALVLRDGAARCTVGGAVVVEAQREAPRHPVRADPPAPRRPDALALAAQVGVAELARVEGEIREVIARDGRVTLPGLRDRLGVSRREAKAFLDYFDAAGVTRRRPDASRVLRHRAGGAPPDRRIDVCAS